ncbi:MAG: type II 3-dehydroquinate dehydratase [Ruminococcaceae bacterium]|nr:type II 3-dehydroquinate dehydratase [Oscillospiraceae bacterium]
MKILVINGPNLNLLGTREPDIYGRETLADINEKVQNHISKLKMESEFFQSNCEGAIIDKLHMSAKEFDGIIINAGAYTHYSYAIRDAIAAIGLPCVEVHMSNVFKREEFRHTSVISPVCIGSICGFGSDSYILAATALYELLNK